MIDGCIFDILHAINDPKEKEIKMHLSIFKYSSKERTCLTYELNE